MFLPKKWNFLCGMEFADQDHRISKYLPKPWSDQQMDEIIGTILRAGVLLSALTVLVGGFFYLRHYGFYQPHYRIFRGEPSDLCQVSGVCRDALRFRAQELIQFGLLLLIATPVVRVAFSIIGFALQTDWLYVIVTAIVLALLLFSLAGGSMHSCLSLIWNCWGK